MLHPDGPVCAAGVQSRLALLCLELDAVIAGDERDAVKRITFGGGPVGRDIRVFPSGGYLWRHGSGGKLQGHVVR